MGLPVMPLACLATKTFSQTIQALYISSASIFQHSSDTLSLWSQWESSAQRVMFWALLISISFLAILMLKLELGLWLHEYAQRRSNAISQSLDDDLANRNKPEHYSEIDSSARSYLNNNVDNLGGMHTKNGRLWSMERFELISKRIY